SRAAEVRRFGGRKVRHDQSVYARLGGRPAKAFEAEGEDRVQVGHEEQRYLRPLPRGACRLECPRDRHATLQCLLGGGLDRPTVGERVRKRNAELDRIRAGLGGGLDQGGRDVEPGVADREVRDQAQPLLRSKPGEGRRDPAHPPLAPRTMSRSLSPRPDRFTSTRSEAASSAASGTAYAIACELSSAGMMPSNREV